jgi:hypothetical protein
MQIDYDQAKGGGEEEVSQNMGHVLSFGRLQLSATTATDCNPCRLMGEARLRRFLESGS